MHDNDSERFKIRLEEDDEQEAPQLSDTPSPPPPSHGLNRTIAIAGLIASLIVGIAGYVLYSDLKHVLETIKNAGESGVTELSTTVGSRLKGISEDTETLKGKLTTDIATLKKQIDPLVKEIPALKKKLKKETAAVSSLKSSMVGKKGLQQKLAATDKKIDAIKTDLQSISASLNTIDETYSREIAVFTQRVKLLDADFQKLNEKTAALKTQSITPDQLAKAIEQLETKFKQDLKKTNKDLSAAIKQGPAFSQSTPAARSAGASPSRPDANNPAGTDLVEQDIAE
jgi:predicted RNase H-like nuclease (RuvC/YqgF family)